MYEYDREFFLFIYELSDLCTISNDIKPILSIDVLI